MRRILIFVLLAMLIAACSSENAVVREQTTQQIKEKSAEGAGETVSLERVRTETEAKNNPAANLVVPSTLKTGAVGDNVIFGTMVNRVNLPKGVYFLKLIFIEARDKGYNKISVDKNLIMKWTDEKTADFELGETAFVPLMFNIRNEIKSGVKTEPGTYQFDVQLYERVEGKFENEISGMVKSIYVKIE